MGDFYLFAMVRVELEQFCKNQSCRELNSLQDGDMFKNNI